MLFLKIMSIWELGQKLVLSITGMLFSFWHNSFLQPAITFTSVQGRVETAVKIATWNEAKLGIVFVERWLLFLQPQMLICLT